ncbi:hypothetical protein [Priestia megaterium]|uniref:hypothetical protein n=1 Tax=Priestia megaterium TaxID=1404 RepID=UPI002363572A|nr:hypothetical protein [Priestia megaterium]MDD1515790.1 hypothetical protein [Priestia megaterium]
MVTIEQFVRIFRTKISYGKKKRLSAIQEYFATEHETQYDFNESDQCLEAIVMFVQEHPQLEEAVFTDIIDLLHDRYSLGDAFILYNASISNNLNFNQLYGVIRNLFENTIERDMFDFDADNIAVDEIGQIVKVKCRYREYQRDIGNDTRSEDVNHSGQIPILFNFEMEKVVINTGYHKAANTLAKAINDSLTNVSLHEINIKNDVLTIPNLVANPTFHPLTLLSISLILEELNRNNYIVNDILSISFNNQQAPRVKKASLGGTNLLQDSDVIHRIYRGDCITNFLLDIIHIKQTDQGDQTDLLAEVLFDFRSGFKISFFNTQTPGMMSVEDASLSIENIIREAINGQNIVQNTIRIINANLPLIQANNQELLVTVLRELRDSLSDIITNAQDRNVVVDYINNTYGV